MWWKLIGWSMRRQVASNVLCPLLSPIRLVLGFVHSAKHADARHALQKIDTDPPERHLVEGHLVARTVTRKDGQESDAPQARRLFKN